MRAVNERQGVHRRKGIRSALVTNLDELIPELRELLAEKCREGHVPGAAVAVCVGDEVIELAHGVLNLDTGVEVTTDSLFQIGSISKTYTATLVMQLVDEGVVELDAPVRSYVPEFSVADQLATETVTVRQLLSHTSGIDGDVFDDYGRGDDALARYVAALRDKRQLYPPGELVSYCNSGFVVLGRLVERVRDLPSWDAALREHLLKPLGVSQTTSLPEEAIMFRAAVGHIYGPDGGLQVVPTWALPRTLGPAGASICASARDVLAYARMHMRGGLAADGTRVLSAESAAAMREIQALMPEIDNLPRDARGLGWHRAGLPHGKAAYGHDGDTIGQYALLQFFPENGIGFVVLTNGGTPAHLFRAVRARVYALADAEPAPLPVPPQAPPLVPEDAVRFLGRYESGARRHDIVGLADGGIGYVDSYLGAMSALADADDEPTTLVGLSPTALITAEPGGGEHGVFNFLEPDADGRPRYLYSGRQIAVRVEGTAAPSTRHESPGR